MTGVRCIGVRVIRWVTAMVGVTCVALPASGADAPEEFVRIAPGTFLMGSPPDESGRFDDEPQHPVTLTRAFLICDHHVTQAEWEAMMDWNDSHFHGHPDRPVETVTWFDCIEYCNRRSEAEGLVPAYRIAITEREGHHISSATVTWDRNADGYRLPTEAEWEYACRAGSVTAFHNGPIAPHSLLGCSTDSVLDAVGWYCANSGRETHDVKTKPANAWGLHDMAGNVQQWCWDRYSELEAAPATDPTGPDLGPARIWRGGGWDYNPRHCRSADRGKDEPWGSYEDVGMRLCRWAP